MPRMPLTIPVKHPNPILKHPNHHRRKVVRQVLVNRFWMNSKNGHSTMHWQPQKSAGCMEWQELEKLASPTALAKG